MAVQRGDYLESAKVFRPRGAEREARGRTPCILGVSCICERQQEMHSVIFYP